MPSPVLLRPLPRLLRPLRSSSGCSASAAQRLSHSVREHSRSLLQKYRSQEQYFKRKLKAAYGRFPEVSDHAVVQGRHHVYFEEGGNIYRKARGQSDQELEEVLIQSEDVVRGALQRVRLSPGERMLAATLKDPKSNMVRGLLVRLGDPPASPRVLLELSDMFSFEWASDDILLFTTMKELRCQTVHRLDLREMPLKSVPVYKEQDPEFFVEVSRTRDGTLLTLNCSSRSSSEVRLVESHMPLRCPRVVQPRLPGLVYHVEHSHRHLYILANTAPGQEYQLLRTHLSSPFMRSWVPVFTPAQGTGLKDMELCRDHCILAVRTPSGTLSLQVVPLANPTKAFALQLPPWACEFEARPSLGLDSDIFQFHLSSPVCPPSHCCYSLKEQQLFIQEDSTGVPLKEHYTTRLEAVSQQDGTLVPMTVLHTASWGNLQEAPLLLHVYGAYGLDLSMGFSPEKQVLLEEGWVLAYCHVRGGGERGLGWHQAGRLQQKHKGVEDLVACVQHLFKLGVSCPTLAALTAHSAGAILAGALCNQHPHLLRAVTLQAPFVDVLGTMQDPTLPLTIEDRGEWGDPLADSQQRDNIASYSPLQNIKPQRYPSMLITAYEGDRRIPLPGLMEYVEKLTSAVQAHGVEWPPSIILDLQPGEDHFGPEDLDTSLNEVSRQLAFLYRELGLFCGGHRQRHK
ncbi:prolyl endopeptidase-like isoform X1 [Scleropages formosus]|nr:prolyl endopeptidase-like isoform X1 [Scleropages formosus]